MDAEFQWEDFQTKNAKWARDIYDEEETFEPSIVFLTKDGEDVTVFVDQFIFSPRLLRKLIIHYIKQLDAVGYGVIFVSKICEKPYDEKKLKKGVTLLFEHKTEKNYSWNAYIDKDSGKVGTWHRKVEVTTDPEHYATAFQHFS